MIRFWDAIRLRMEKALYQEAVDFLESRINYETFLSIPYRVMKERLQHLRRLLDFLGAPDKNYPIIHVAGTKGKGSTCIFLEQILVHAGYRVGRFSSPHLHSLMERFSIDGTLCSEERFSEVFAELKARVVRWEQTDPGAIQNKFQLTYFEWITLIAFELFALEKVDFAVLEVGMGGRFDATNICQPVLSIISSISYDHIQQLGPTLKDIASEKCGIIKPNVPVVSGVHCGVRREDPRDVIRAVAKKRHCLCVEIDTDFSFEASDSPDTTEDAEVFDFTAKIPDAGQPVRYEHLFLAAIGDHQLRNASVAIAAVELIKQNGKSVPEEAIRGGLKSVQLPARVEVVSQNPLWIVDGSHNRASVEALIASIQKRYQVSGKKYLLFASMLGKDNEGMLSEIAGFFDWIIFTQYPNNPRAFPAQALFLVAAACLNDPNEDLSNPKKIPGEVIIDVREAVQKLQSLAEANDLVCTAGSLYLAAIVREVLLGQ